MQTLPIGSQRGWDGWGGWGMVLSVHCGTLRGGEKTLFNQPLCILGIVRISDGSSKTQHQPQQRTELRQSGEKTKKNPPEEPHELGYRTTSSAISNTPAKQTNKKILPLPFPSSHHGQTSLCCFCFYLLFFEREEAAAKKWRRISSSRLSPRVSRRSTRMKRRLGGIMGRQSHHAREFQCANKQNNLITGWGLWSGNVFTA